MFQTVIACDISKPHLKLAADWMREHDVDNIMLKDVYSPKEIAELTSGVDVIYSVIALQHNPPPLIAEYIKVLLSRLNPGGLAFFQVPTSKRGYSFLVDSYLNDLEQGKVDYMEVHAIPQKALFEIVRDQGCRLVEIREDAWVGDEATISNTLLVERGLAERD
jgi:cyclopropane fatty-acyl-phospholipid synthase-like methyltransferase